MSTLRVSARIAMVVGAAGSVSLMLWAGQRNPSSFLMFLFAGWVTLPFVALAFADYKSSRWSDAARTTLHLLALVTAVTALAVYTTVVFGPMRQRVAPWFLMLPLASLVLLALVAAISEYLARSLPTQEK